MENQPPKIRYIDTLAALQLAAREGVNITRPTLISWIYKYDLGYKVAGRWYVDQDKLEKVLKGELQ